MSKTFQDVVASSGEISQRIATKDWASTPLGPIDEWAPALQQSLLFTLSHGFPTLIALGEELIVLYNDAYSQLLGDTDEALGRPLAQLWPQVWPRIEPGVHQALDGIPNVVQDVSFTRMRPGHAGQIWLDVSFSPLRNNSGAVLGIVCNCIDRTQSKIEISQRVQAELALNQYVTKLADANQELEAFAYSVSHDLRAPLRTISGFSEILEEDYYEELNEDGRAIIQHIIQGTELMKALIDDILRLYKVSRKEMQSAAVNLSELALSIVNELRAGQPDRPVEISLQDNLYAEGDQALLYVALTNLLENAWKFTAGRPTARIEFGAQIAAETVTYFVRDNGVGFPKEITDRLFEPFQRLHTESEFAGTGIGLPIAKRVISRHGGKIWAEGDTGSGATFYFTLNDQPAGAA